MRVMFKGGCCDIVRLGKCAVQHIVLLQMIREQGWSKSGGLFERVPRISIITYVRDARCAGILIPAGDR